MKTMETRKYRVIPTGSKGVTVTISGSYENDAAWRAVAALAAGYPDLDSSFASERVIRLFPWWVS